MRRRGESTLVDVDDAGIQSLEVAVTEADELIESGDESGARRSAPRRTGSGSSVVTMSEAADSSSPR